MDKEEMLARILRYNEREIVVDIFDAEEWGDLAGCVDPYVRVEQALLDFRKGVARLPLFDKALGFNRVRFADILRLAEIILLYYDIERSHPR